MSSIRSHRKFHIICSECGAGPEWVRIKSDKNLNTTNPDECVGIYISCVNCGQLCSIEEWNEGNTGQTVIN